MSPYIRCLMDEGYSFLSWKRLESDYHLISISNSFGMIVGRVNITEQEIDDCGCAQNVADLIDDKIREKLC